MNSRGIEIIMNPKSLIGNSNKSIIAKVTGVVFDADFLIFLINPPRFPSKSAIDVNNYQTNTIKSQLPVLSRKSKNGAMTERLKGPNGSFHNQPKPDLFHSPNLNLDCFPHPLCCFICLPYLVIFDVADFWRLEISGSPSNSTFIKREHLS
jgi:hypothetical protein